MQCTAVLLRRCNAFGASTAPHFELASNFYFTAAKLRSTYTLSFQHNLPILKDIKTVQNFVQNRRYCGLLQNGGFSHCLWSSNRRFLSSTGQKPQPKKELPAQKYRSFRDKYLGKVRSNRTKISKSFKTFKDVYSDKKVIESGIDLSKMSLYHRMKYLVTHYGKVFIPLHYIFFTGFWFAVCYAAVYLGVDITPWLEKLPENVQEKLHLDKMAEYKKTGIALQAVALYKLLTPLRYVVSVSSTLYLVRYLRGMGYFITPPSVKEAVRTSVDLQRQTFTVRRSKWRNRFRRKRRNSPPSN